MYMKYLKKFWEKCIFGKLPVLENISLSFTIDMQSNLQN